MLGVVHLHEPEDNLAESGLARTLLTKGRKDDFPSFTANFVKLAVNQVGISRDQVAVNKRKNLP